MGMNAMILMYWMLSFKPAFSLSSFTFVKRLFSTSLLSPIRVVSSAYLRLLIFLLALLITACASPSPTLYIVYDVSSLFCFVGTETASWKYCLFVWSFFFSSTLIYLPFGVYHHPAVKNKALVIRTQVIVLSFKKLFSLFGFSPWDLLSWFPLPDSSLGSPFLVLIVWTASKPIL